MKQIPNIEETHNTREVEEVVKEFYKIFDTDNLWQGEDEWTKNVPIGNIEQWLRTTLHHQLQKAREEAVIEFASKLRVLIERGNAETAMNIIKNYSELNQDKK